MAKKTVTSGEFTITREASGTIKVHRIYNNTIGALREIAEKEGFDYDSSWNTQTFGAKLIDFIEKKGN